MIVKHEPRGVCASQGQVPNCAPSSGFKGLVCVCVCVLKYVSDAMSRCSWIGSEFPIVRGKPAQ